MKQTPDNTKSATRDADSRIGTDFGADYGAKLFDTLPKLMRPEQFAEHFGYSVATIYDWRYRGVLRGVPSGLFLTLNRRLYIRTDIFWTWIASQNPDVESGIK
jgi:Helix-turn-helix domain